MFRIIAWSRSLKIRNPMGLRHSTRSIWQTSSNRSITSEPPDAWSIKYLGKNWPSEKRERIADLLFSRETDASGNPKGIGLSLWRVNFGGGSLENPCPNTGNIWANMPCMRAENSTYQLNMNDPAGGQFWMLKAAKERGCESNSSGL